MEFSDGCHNTNIPNIDSLSETKYPVSNDDVLKELQTINNNFSFSKVQSYSDEDLSF